MIRVTVRQRPDREHLQLAYVDPISGRVRTKSAGTPDWDEAQRAAERWATRLAAYRGEDCDWASFRVRFEDEYLPDVRPSTALAYGTALRHFERHIGKVRSMRSITASVCSDFAARLRGAKLAAPSIAKHLRHLRAALRWAESVGILERAPRVTMPKLGNHRRTSGRPLTETEFENILQAVPAGPQRANWQHLLRGLWLSGLRVSEALALSWTDPPVRLDLAGDHPAIIFEASGQKANRAERVPITPDFAELLLATPAAKRRGPVFPLTTRSRTDVSRRIADLGRSAGVTIGPNRHATAHDLRRSFATRWALRVHPLTLRAIMRHATMQTTMAYYVDLDADKISADLYTSVYTAQQQKPPRPANQPRKTSRKKSVPD